MQKICNKMQKKEMYDMHYVSLTYDNRYILTIERDKQDCAYVRCYILDSHSAEKEFLEHQIRDGKMSTVASVVSFNESLRK